ncbi:transmembrane protein 68-like [Lacerta agilis]|uniref:transmembrane protein 68-like n=1 Tax=Lacerta agilis TaxID=80427 RepID=UPI00141A3137|nr:transmembrane protein 68-like [Lacerta agilis]
MRSFTQMLGNWISFPYLEEYLSSVALSWWFCNLLILPCSIFIIIYLFVCAISFVMYVHKKMNNQQETDFDSKCWKKPKQVACQILDIYGKIWHGYEVFGMEHLPKGPGIVIFYHPVCTIDYFLFVARLNKETERECFTVVDHFIYRFPGWKTTCDACGMKDFNKAESVEILKKGHLLGISPGGAREGNFSKDYNIMWGKRTGFARVALEAKVPIIPIFTQNSCETYRNIGNTRLTRWLYEKTRNIYLPMYGGFPVKLRTYIGEPIPYDPNITAAELAEKTKTAIENLRDKYQKRPGSILRALSERFDKHYKAN